MHEKIKIGVIGVGLRGQHSYEQILRHDPRVEVKAVSIYPGINQTLLEGKDVAFFEQYADDLGAEYYGEDYQSLLSREDIDLISLMCEPSRALKLGMECLSADKHVLRDKPVAKTSEDAFALQATAEKAGRQLLLAMPLRYHRPLVQARENVLNGSIGEILAINMSYVWNSGPLYDFTASNEYLDCYGGGDVTTAGYHAIDYLNWLTESKPAKVYCEQGSFFYDDYQAVDMDDFGQIVMEYDSGVVATLIAGRVPARVGCGNWLDITGTDGTIELRNFMPSMRIEGSEIKTTSFDHDPLNSLLRDMLDCIETAKLYSCNAYDGAVALSVLEAARLSSETHKSEKNLPLIREEKVVLSCSR